MIGIIIIFMIMVMYKIKGFGDAHMKVSREQVAEHRSQILAAAARLFRLRGFEEVTVTEVSRSSGGVLT
jgi:TetR/AcrR family transcriptional repressor of nem operon